MKKSVDLPEAGEGINLACTLPAMEALHEAHGETYIATTIAKLDKCDIATIKLCLGSMASAPVDLAALVDVMPLEALSLRLADAIWLGVKGERLTETPEA